MSRTLKQGYWVIELPSIRNSYSIPMKKQTRKVFIDMQHQEKGLIEYGCASTFIENQFEDISCETSVVGKEK